MVSEDNLDHWIIYKEVLVKMLKLPLTIYIPGFIKSEKCYQLYQPRIFIEVKEKKKMVHEAYVAWSPKNLGWCMQ